MKLNLLNASILTAVVVMAGQAAVALDPVIEAARHAALLYAQSLPDYVVKRTTTRYRKTTGVPSAEVSRSTPPSRLAQNPDAPDWQTVDTVTADVTVERGKEVYADIRVNGEPAKTLPRGGSWSAGEFSSEMLMIFAPEHAALFTHARAESIGSRPAWRYDFEVDRAHSTWNMAAVNIGYGHFEINDSPAYSGKLWIDKATGQMLSVEMSAQDLPRAFPVATVESRTEYEFVTIGDEKYLLPAHSETVSCGPRRNICLRNQTDFRDYGKFRANAKISFGDVPK